MAKTIQTDWLDYWFAPRMTFVRVRNSEYIATVQAMQAAGDWVAAVAVTKDGYELTVYRKKHDENKNPCKDNQ